MKIFINCGLLNNAKNNDGTISLTPLGIKTALLMEL